MSRPPEPIYVDGQGLDDLVQRAQAAPRQRLNWNFHPGPEHPCHRLAIALEPGSYIPPHCHLDTEKDETLLVLRGRIGLVIFTAEGAVHSTRVLSAGGDCLGVTLAPGTVHSLVALETGSVFFEAKAGPYAAPMGAECPPWAPREGSPEAGILLEKMHAFFQM